MKPKSSRFSSVVSTLSRMFSKDMSRSIFGGSISEWY